MSHDCPRWAQGTSMSGMSVEDICSMIFACESARPECTCEVARLLREKLAKAEAKSPRSGFGVKIGRIGK